MKRLISVFLLLIYILSLTSCFAKDNEAESVDEVNEPDEPQKPAHVCEFVNASRDLRYLKSNATCTEPMQYYYSCTCRGYGEETFSYGDTIPHVYDLNTPTEQYLKKEATVKSPAVYYKSCKCGKAGEDTFRYGASIPLDETQRLYLPTSVTVTMYDVENSVFGFTYNTVSAPITPAIQIKKAGESEWEEHVPTFCEAETLDGDGALTVYYISKVEIALEPGTVYVYRVCDKGADVYTPEGNLEVKSSKTDSFTFVHVSDSQAGVKEFGQVLGSVIGEADFVIHTGDVVQNSKYESEWTEMLDSNYEYVMDIPMMPISGNHETSYSGATYETDKHFNSNIPEQESTRLGYYYSFVYGNVKFIMLNTNDLDENNRIKAEQYDWLINELEGNNSRWTVVSMHNPMYSVGKYGVDETKNAVALALREQLQGVFAQYGVDLVLQGHDHAVSRTFPINGEGSAEDESVETVDGIDYIVDPSGVIYVMNGPAGTQTRLPISIDESVYAYAEGSKKASWAEITVSEDSLIITVKWFDGQKEQMYHTWGIKKS